MAGDLFAIVLRCFVLAIWMFRISQAQCVIDTVAPPYPTFCPVLNPDIDIRPFLTAPVGTATVDHHYNECYECCSCPDDPLSCCGSAVSIFLDPGLYLITVIGASCSTEGGPCNYDGTIPGNPENTFACHLVGTNCGPRFCDLYYDSVGPDYVFYYNHQGGDVFLYRTDCYWGDNFGLGEISFYSVPSECPLFSSAPFCEEFNATAFYSDVDANLDVENTGVTLEITTPLYCNITRNITTDHCVLFTDHVLNSTNISIPITRSLLEECDFTVQSTTDYWNYNGLVYLRASNMLDGVLEALTAWQLSISFPKQVTNTIVVDVEPRPLPCNNGNCTVSYESYLVIMSSNCKTPSGEDTYTAGQIICLKHVILESGVIVKPTSLQLTDDTTVIDIPIAESFEFTGYGLVQFSIPVPCQNCIVTISSVLLPAKRDSTTPSMKDNIILTILAADASSENQQDNQNQKASALGWQLSVGILSAFLVVAVVIVIVIMKKWKAQLTRRFSTVLPETEME